MAKKPKVPSAVFPAAININAPVEYYGSGRKSNQHSEGVLEQPDYNTDPSNAGRKKKGNLSFPSMVAMGESPDSGDVNSITPNGVSSSRGMGHNQDPNWWEGTDGHWNKSGDFKGGNRTGE